MGKPTTWARRVESKQKNPRRKLIGMSRREKWAWERDGELENPRCGSGVRKASRKTHGVCFREKSKQKNPKPEVSGEF